MQQEEEAHDRHHDEFLDQLLLEVRDRAANELGAIVGRDDLHARGQSGLERLELRLHRLDRRQRVLALAHHDDAAHDLAFAVQLGDAAPHLGADLDARDVAQRDGRARLAHVERDRAEIVERLQVAARSHHVLGLAQLEDAAAGFAIGVLQGGDDARVRNAVGAQPIGIENDLVLAHHAADGGDLGHVGHALQLVLEEPVLDRAQLPEVVAARSIDERVLVDPADAGGIGPEGGFRLRRKARLHLVQVLEHARARPVEVDAVLEQHVDERRGPPSCRAPTSSSSSADR